MKRFLTAALLAPIRAYQRWISPGLPRRCKYEPTCSDYAVEAIRELGPARGIVLASWRLLRCNPLSDGGIDDLADRRLLRDVPGHSGQDAAHAHRHGRSPAAASERCDAPRAGTGASA